MSDECQNSTDKLTVELPCQLIERIEKYANENKTNITGILIEALDTFLRGVDKKN